MANHAAGPYLDVTRATGDAGGIVPPIHQPDDVSGDAAQSDVAKARLAEVDGVAGLNGDGGCAH